MTDASAVGAVGLSAAESPSGGADEYRIRPVHWLALIVVLLCSAGLRFARIDATSVWCDELLSLHLSDGHNFAVDHLPRNQVLTTVPDLVGLSNARPVWTVWTSLSDDVHPPLYYMTLRLWREVFGDTPTAIRSLSAVLGTLAVGAVFFAGREFLGSAAGVWVAAMNAVACDHIYFGQEARMYALGLLWTSLSLALLLRTVRLGWSRRRGVALAAITLAGVLTLYLYSPVAVAEAAYVIACLRGSVRRNVLLAFGGVAIVFALMWLPFLFGPAFRSKKPDWLLAEPAGHVALTLGRALRLPLEHLGVLSRSSEWSAYVFAIVYALPLLLIRRCPRLALPWMVTIACVALPTLSDLLRTTNMLMWERYTVLMIPAVSLVFVGIVWTLQPGSKWRTVLPAAVVFFGIVSLPALYLRERFDFRSNAKVAWQALQESHGRVVFATQGNHQFNSVLLLSAQYFWPTPPSEVLLVESLAELETLPRDVVGDDLVLVTGDANADLSQLPSFECTGRTTWQLGVGSVHALRRR